MHELGASCNSRVSLVEPGENPSAFRKAKFSLTLIVLDKKNAKINSLKLIKHSLLNSVPDKRQR